MRTHIATFLVGCGLMAACSQPSSPNTTQTGLRQVSLSTAAPSGTSRLCGQNVPAPVESVIYAGTWYRLGSSSSDDSWNRACGALVFNRIPSGPADNLLVTYAWRDLFSGRGYRLNLAVTGNPSDGLRVQLRSTLNYFVLHPQANGEFLGRFYNNQNQQFLEGIFRPYPGPAP